MAAKKKASKAKDMKDVMSETQKQDKFDSMAEQANKHIKEANMLMKEMICRLKACALETSDVDSIDGDLVRVQALCRQITNEAGKALKKLPLGL